MTEAQLGAIIADAICSVTDPLKARIAELESRAATGVEYRGVFEASAQYPRGSLVTRNGSLWLALTDAAPATPPGLNPSVWKLIVKGAS